MAGLGDILAAAATGQNPDYQNIEATAALKGATFQDTMAQVPLRGAQTQEALQNADKARLEALRTQRQLDAIDNIKQKQATDPTYKPSLGDLMAIDQNTQQAAAATGDLQTQGFKSTLASPTATPAEQVLAEQGATGKVVNPYVAAPIDSVDLRTIPAAGQPMNDQLSKVGQATVGQKEAAANLANSKVTSNDGNVDLNEISYLGYRGANDKDFHPSFGMGQSKTREYYLKALALASEGAPITYDSLGVPMENRGGGGVRPGATTIAPTGAAGPNPGGNPHETPTTLAAAGTYPANNPADNAPAVAPGTPNTVAPAAAAPAGPAPLSPQDAANSSIARGADVKSQSMAMNAATKMLAMTQAQGYKAHQAFGRALGFADQLAQTQGADGSPLINKAIQDWKSNITGDPLTRDFVHEISIAHDEYAKIMSGAVGAGGITDAGRTAADALFNKYMNYATLKSLGPLMDKDANDARVGYVNTIQSMHEGIAHPASGGITGNAGAVASGNPQAVAPKAAAAPTAVVHINNNADYAKLTSGQHYVAPDGVERIKP